MLTDHWIREHFILQYITAAKVELSGIASPIVLSKLVVILTTCPNFAGAYGMVVPDAVQMALVLPDGGPSRRPADLRAPTAPALSATSNSCSP